MEALQNNGESNENYALYEGLLDSLDKLRNVQEYALWKAKMKKMTWENGIRSKILCRSDFETELDKLF